MSTSYIEIVDIECDRHVADGCVCDNGVLTIAVDHGDDLDYDEEEYAEPDYESIWLEREEARYERWLDRMDRLY